MKTTIKEVKRNVDKSINNFYHIADRVEFLDEILSKSNIKYLFNELPMGSGGVGQIKEMKDGSIRFQIGYGHGRYNYATVLVVRF